MSGASPTVALDARFLGNPGLGRYVRELIGGLADADLDFDLLAVVSEPGSDGDLPAGVAQRFVSASPFTVREQFELPYRLARWDVDLYHATQFTVPVAWRGPLVTTIHDCAYDRFPEEFNVRGPVARIYYRLMMRAAVRRSGRVIAVSESTRDDLDRFYGADLDRVTTVYEGVDAGRFADANGDEAPVDHEYLLYVGSNRPRKNLERLLDAYARFVADREDPPLLVLAGEFDDRFLDVDAAIRERDLEDQSTCLGFVDETTLSRLYAGALGFVFPSRYEGFGLPVLEAMAAGTPVVAADASALPEVAGEAAEYVDPTSTESIAAGIAAVVDSTTLHGRLADAGHDRAATLSWARTAEQTIQVYLDLLG